MLTPVLAKIPGSLIFQALKDGEPMAFVIVGVVVTMIASGFAIKHVVAKAQ